MDVQKEIAWDEVLGFSRERGLYAKQLYVVISEPVDGLGPILANRDAHVAHQVQLEEEGVMFAAGPLATSDGLAWRGTGMFVYRAGSLAEAAAHAERDPMHRAGARTYRILPWLLNEGSRGIAAL